MMTDRAMVAITAMTPKSFPNWSSGTRPTNIITKMVMASRKAVDPFSMAMGMIIQAESRRI